MLLISRKSTQNQKQAEKREAERRISHGTGAFCYTQKRHSDPMPLS
jgi:hypothetical protein